MFNRKHKIHSAKEDIMRVVGPQTPFAISESFRTLYTNVLYLPITDKCRKIAITSAVSGEGKSYISVNLAITLATTSNKKVLLVDLDIRKPEVKTLIESQIEGEHSDNGVSEYLVGIDEKPNVLKTTIPNLDVLYSGMVNSNPIGLLNSDRTNVLFDKLSESYDYIIVDTPPVTIVTDALLLLNKVNGYILATRADYSNINSLSLANETIKKVGGAVYGVVLTSVNPKTFGVKKKKYPSEHK